MLQLGRSVDHYKLLSWLCSTIVWANPDLRVFCELKGVRLKRMFVAYGASLHGFIMRCQKFLFIDRAILSSLYTGTLLAAIARGIDDHLFDV